jgi:N-acyl-D-amino-acid deacylase
MVGSDGGIGVRHPRGAGTFPKVLGRYVRDLHWITLPEAIRKMTSMPADRLQLRDRGRIAAGTIADVVLLNPSSVVDRSTFSDPTALPVGIQKVLVAGELVWDGGQPVTSSQKRPGRVMATPN